MALVRGFKAKANRIAIQIRAQLDLAEIDPLDPLRVCEVFEIQLIPLSKLLDADGQQAGQYFLKHKPKEFSAAVIPRGLRRAIVHNDMHEPNRQRSNITHELAHCFLKHPLVPLLAENGDRNRHAEMEEEAAFLGGALLIPDQAAHHIVRTSMGARAELVYGVSRKMLNYRLKVSGAIIAQIRRASRAFS